MSCNRVEPIPTTYYIPGNLVASPGMGIIYEIKSYPLCRLYYDATPNAKYPLQPHSFEYKPNKKAGEGNYLSYLVSVYGSSLKVDGESKEFYITDHCLKPIAQIKGKHNETETSK